MRQACRFSLVLVATLLASSCGSPGRDVLTLPTAPTSTVPIGSDFTLAPGESVVVNSGALTLTFVRVTNESRCPTQALIQCVWAGSAVIGMRSVAGSTTGDMTLETVANKNEKLIGNYLVQLVDVTPAPRTLDSIPAATYRAVLRVSRK